jgi:AGZA family xanthine/uracil permease-like MFS transporter
MGISSNLPVAVAPAMGLNAYLAYQIVGFHGTGPINYRVAMMAVFVEGFIFIALSLLGIRQWLARIIPASIKVACGAGIGLFLTLIGLSYSAGIGAITGSKATPLELGGCPPQYRDENTGACLSHKATSPTMWLGFMVGGVLTALLMTYKVRGAMIVGIALVSIFSWPRDTSVTFFPRTEIGDSRFEFFKNVVAFHPIKRTLAVQDWTLSTIDGNVAGQFILAVFTMLYVDILDATGTLYSMARFSGVVDPDTGDFPKSTIAYSADAFAISIGSLFGSSPVTAFVESGSGIQEGGRTGLTSMTTGVCFFISLFFAPVFASIPPWATGGALILVGCMMMRGMTAINWNYPGDSIPAFVTLMFMPFSYSIAYGLVAGIMCYAIINTFTWALGAVSRGRLLPPDYDDKEYWSCKPNYLCTSSFIQLTSLSPRRLRSQPALVHPRHQGRQAFLEARVERLIRASICGDSYQRIVRLHLCCYQRTTSSLVMRHVHKIIDYTHSVTLHDSTCGTVSRAHPLRIMEKHLKSLLCINRWWLRASLSSLNLGTSRKSRSGRVAATLAALQATSACADSQSSSDSGDRWKVPPTALGTCGTARSNSSENEERGVSSHSIDFTCLELDACA